MEKLFTLLITFTLFFTTCDNGNNSDTATPLQTTLKINNQSSSEIADVMWNNVSFAPNQIDNSIIAGTNVTKNVSAGSGYIYFTRKTNPVTARTASVITVMAGENIEFIFSRDTLIVEVNNTGNIGTLESLRGTELEIKNESLIEITDVIWQNVPFVNTQYENSIKTGTSVNNAVTAGSGYVFFKRKSNPITARTRDLVFVEQSQKNVFTFNDDTIIVEANNPGNTGVLGSLQATVVWWDDAERELQPYYENRNFVGYYTRRTDLFYQNAANLTYFYYPKNGNKSIAIGGTTTAMMHLKINLDKKAKLSFWYANRVPYSNTAGSVFSINGVETLKWTTDVNWSFSEFDLEPGINDLKWEKKDGYYYYSSNYTYYCYLSLDDILIYYTE